MLKILELERDEWPVKGAIVLFLFQYIRTSRFCCFLLRFIFV